MNLAPFLAPLFVPAHRPERYEKAAASGADAVIIDLEDAVAADAKDQARAALRAGFAQIPILVRINGVGTSWHADDLAAVARFPFSGIVVPKSELGSDLQGIAETLSMPVLALIETVRGLAQARDIATLPGVTRLVFGSVDFCADLGCAHERSALLTARSEIVMASRLAGRPAPIDGITTAIDDVDLVASDARYAFDLGFGGKLAIHPRQVEAIVSGFCPQTAEIDWAKNVLASGSGAAAIDGAMVDEPVRIRARTILARAEQCITPHSHLVKQSSDDDQLVHTRT